MKKKTWAHLARLAVLLGALLGGWMWYLHPENGSKWAVMVFLLPVAVGIWELVKRTRSPSDEAQLRINRALTGAGLLLAAALALQLADAYDLLAGDMSDRAMGVILGIVVVIIGNSMPKTLEPLAKKGCEPSKTQALQRFAGWTFVLSGLAYSLVWLVFPLEPAGLISTLILAACVLLVAARLLSAVRPRRRES